MTIQTINLGTYANDGQGDDLRSAFEKVNNNFTHLDNISAVDGTSLGNGSPVFAGKVNDILTFRSIKAGNNINISFDTTAITIVAVDSINSLQEDSTPSLGGNLNLNSRDITGTGNININGTITANSFTGDLLGHVLGNADTVTNGVYTVGNQIIAGVKTFQNSIVGNLTGNADTVTNGVYTTSSINALADVDTSSIPPVIGNILKWDGSNWVPSSGGGVVEPSSSFDFGTFTDPSSISLDLGPFA